MGKNSEALFERAQRVMPGGVNSPVRAFDEVGGTPRFIEQGQGSRIFDVDNLQYIDCTGSWGPLILGHAHRYVVEAVKRQATRGFTYGAPTLDEVELAESVCSAIPSIEMMRLVSSAAEAAMSAIRIARAETGRKRILKFDGCYHGNIDALLAGSPGVPEEAVSLTTSVPYNNLDAVTAALAAHPGEFAVIIVEPVASRMGCVPAVEGFLKGLRRLCDVAGTLLVFDETVTGFRVTFGGAQNLYDVRPDLTLLGDIIGGGLPIAAYGGSRKLMESVAPGGPVYQTGLMAGNPIAVAAGKSTLSILRNEAIYRDLEERSHEFETGCRRAAQKHGVVMQFNRVGSMWTIFFTSSPVTDLATAKQSNLEKFALFFNLMLAEGVYLPPSQFEAAYFSSAHAKKDIQQLIERTDRALKKVAWEFDS